MQCCSSWAATTPRAIQSVVGCWRSTSFLLIVAVLGIVAIHTVEAWAWAAVLLRLGEFASLKEALYFSVVTSTTLGYGDLTLSDEWKLLGTFEAMGGLILFGASTAFLFQLMQRLFSDEGA